MSSQRVGRYELRALLGKGSRAIVFAGVDPQDGRAVAVKLVPREHIDADGLAAYLALLPQLRALDHDSIARPLDVVEGPKHVALVSAAVAKGESLAALLANSTKLPDVKSSWEILRQVCEALAVAHVHGVVHRDVKASNILMDPTGRATLVDLASAMVHAQPPASVEHFAPEHFDQGKVGPRSDVYQVGILAYRLTTGRVPFTGAPDEIRHRVMEERPSDPSSFNPKLAWQFDWVVQKALAKEPGERSASVLDLAEGLRLGLQDTWGRPLDPVKISAPQAAPAQAVATKAAPSPATPPQPATPQAPTPEAAPPQAATPLRQNARSLAAAKPAAPAVPASTAGTMPRPEAPAKPAPVPTRETATRPTLLFVDDDPRILNGLKALFREDVETIAVDNGAAALEVIARQPVHVIVSDQRMPQMTGVALLREVRKRAPHVVRILLTGYTDLASLVGSINEGEIHRFVKKPWDNAVLRQAVMEAVQIALAQAEAPLAAAKSPRSAGSLLVIDPTGELASGLNRLLAGNAEVKLAATVVQAAKMLAEHEFGVVVADASAGIDALGALFRDLRAKRPEVASIVLTDEPDSEVAIDLVNRAHVFRFLPKPVAPRELRSQVAQALRRHASLRQARAKVDSASLEGTRPRDGEPVARPA